MFVKRVKVRSYEKGLLFKDKEFEKILDPGKYWCVDFTNKTKVDIVSQREPLLMHEDIDLLISSNQLGEEAKVVELTDDERALIWVDKRFAKILGPGQHILWRGYKDIRVEKVKIDKPKFIHQEIRAILESDTAEKNVVVHRVAEGFVGVVFFDGDFAELVKPGKHIYWRNSVEVRVIQLDVREATLDVSGQDIITKDKVTLRLNGLVTYKVVDPVKAVSEVENFQQSLYRETQLALRTVVGTQDIDRLLSDKDSLALQVKDILKNRAAEFGLNIIGFGIRDIILPGDMKELLNKVVESQKAAEANLITRREETAAMRSQANTAKILANNPTLMRLKEFETLEKVAEKSNLNIVCGEGPLADKIVKLV